MNRISNSVSILARFPAMSYEAIYGGIFFRSVKGMRNKKEKKKESLPDKTTIILYCKNCSGQMCKKRIKCILHFFRWNALYPLKNLSNSQQKTTDMDSEPRESSLLWFWVHNIFSHNTFKVDSVEFSIGEADLTGQAGETTHSHFYSRN